MKKLLCIIMILLATVSAFGTEPDIGGWFRPILGIQADYVFKSDVVNVGPEGLGDSEVIANGFMKFNVKAGALLWRWVWFEMDTDTYTSLPSTTHVYNGAFSPYQSDYGFKVGLQHWGVRVGYEHWCYHPVISSGTEYVRGGGVNEWFVDFSLTRFILDMKPEKRYWSELAQMDKGNASADVAFRLSYIPWYHSSILNTETNTYYDQYVEDIFVVGGDVEFTFFKTVWISSEADVYFTQPFPQFDLKLSAGLVFKGIRVGYVYQIHDVVVGSVPIRGWYGNTQSVFIGFDLEDLYRSNL